MNLRIKLIAALGALLLIQGMAEAAAPGSTKAYRWKDKDGVTHIGDSVPPEYSPQGQSELNPQGVPLHETPRQLSPAEDSEARQKATTAARLKQNDDYLQRTYTSVREIERLRDERLAQIDAQMELVRGSMSSNNQGLAGLKDRMRNFVPYSSASNARRLPDQLAEEVVRALKEQRSLQEAMASREAEKNQQRTQFDADIARYRELAGRPASR